MVSFVFISIVLFVNLKTFKNIKSGYNRDTSVPLCLGKNAKRFSLKNLSYFEL